MPHSYSGEMGWGWDHNYNKRMLELYSGDIIYFSGSGRRERFEAQKKDGKITGYEAPKGWFVELSKKEVPKANYEIILDGGTWEFKMTYEGRTIKSEGNVEVPKELSKVLGTLKAWG